MSGQLGWWRRLGARNFEKCESSCCGVERRARREKASLKNNSVMYISPSKTLTKVLQLFYNSFLVAGLYSKKKKKFSSLNFISCLHVIKHYFKDMCLNGSIMYHNIFNQSSSLG